MKIKNQKLIDAVNKFCAKYNFDDSLYITGSLMRRMRHINSSIHSLAMFNVIAHDKIDETVEIEWKQLLQDYSVDLSQKAKTK